MEKHFIFYIFSQNKIPITDRINDEPLFFLSKIIKSSIFYIICFYGTFKDKKDIGKVELLYSLTNMALSTIASGLRIRDPSFLLTIPLHPWLSGDLQFYPII